MNHIGAYVPAPLVIGVVSSRDGAPQLDTLLTSLLTYCEDPFYLDLRVLYSSGSEEGLLRYRLVERQWRDVLPISFDRVNQFRRDLLGTLGLSDRYNPRADSPAAAAYRRISGRRERLERVPVAWRHLLVLRDDHEFAGRFCLADVAGAAWQRAGLLGLSLEASEAGPVDGATGCLFTPRVIAPLLSSLAYSCPDSLDRAVGEAGERFRLHPEWPRMTEFEPAVLRRQGAGRGLEGVAAGAAVPVLAGVF